MRRIPTLSQAAPLLSASRELVAAKRVLIISGFYIGKAKAWETDGPLGSLVLADVLEQGGATVTLLTDEGCLPMFESGKRLLGLSSKLLGFPPGQEPDAEQLLTLHQPDLLVAIERPGQAADGHYYNASGFDISSYVAHFDSLVRSARQHYLPTIAVGDGGNELGFGAKREEACRLLGPAKAMACVTSADYLITCGVSNWGAYALAALAARQNGSASICDEQSLVELLQTLVEAGAVDGVDLARVPTVDGLPLQEELGMFSKLIQSTFGVTRSAD
jgi:hypothetical protein